MNVMARARTGLVASGVLVLPGTDLTLDAVIEKGRVMATEDTH